MSFFDNIKLIKDSLSKTANDIANNIATTSMEQDEINKINKEINSLNSEIDAAHTQVGRRFVEYVIETKEMPGIDVSDILKALDPKLSRKKELENELIQIQKRLKDQMIIQEKAKVEQEYIREKEKLDKALAMDVISQEEYSDKLSIYRKKLDNFEQIKKIDQQCNLGIISREERDYKINNLLK